LGVGVVGGAVLIDVDAVAADGVGVPVVAGDPGSGEVAEADEEVVGAVIVEGAVEIEIDPFDYDLVDKDDVDISDFEANDMKEYLESIGYYISETEANFYNNEDVKEYVDKIPNWKYKDLICDMLNLSHYASFDEITSALKEKIRK
jgi:hypothetical protein